MKIRIYGKSLRWRLGRAEVQRLAAGETLLIALPLLPQSLRFAMNGNALDGQWLLRFTDGQIALSLPPRVVKEWADSDALSIRQDIPAVGQESITVLIEKDLECLHGSGENQEDCYPNPLAEKGASSTV